MTEWNYRPTPPAGVARVVCSGNGCWPTSVGVLAVLASPIIPSTSLDWELGDSEHPVRRDVPPMHTRLTTEQLALRQFTEADLDNVC